VKEGTVGGKGIRNGSELWCEGKPSDSSIAEHGRRRNLGKGRRVGGGFGVVANWDIDKAGGDGGEGRERDSRGGDKRSSRW
jgi:hypothetical protein